MSAYYIIHYYQVKATHHPILNNTTTSATHHLQTHLQTESRLASIMSLDYTDFIACFLPIYFLFFLFFPHWRSYFLSIFPHILSPILPSLSIHYIPTITLIHILHHITHFIPIIPIISISISISSSIFNRLTIHCIIYQLVIFYRLIIHCILFLFQSLFILYVLFFHFVFHFIFFFYFLFVTFWVLTKWWQQWTYFYNFSSFLLFSAFFWFFLFVVWFVVWRFMTLLFLLCHHFNILSLLPNFLLLFLRLINPINLILLKHLIQWFMCMYQMFLILFLHNMYFFRPTTK